MSTPFNAAAAAYNSAAKLITQNSKGLTPSLETGTQGDDFAKLLANLVQGVADAGQHSDQMALDMVNGKANIVDVVTAVSETELAMESMVTIRDRVISAYEEIMRMPI